MNQGTATFDSPAISGGIYQVNFKPVLDRILVHEDPVPELKVIGHGLVASQHYTRDRSYIGTVVAVGDGVPMAGVIMPMPYKVGDRVRLDQFGGEPWYRRPEDEFSGDKRLPKFWIYRVADTQGKELA